MYVKICICVTIKLYICIVSGSCGQRITLYICGYAQLRAVDGFEFTSAAHEHAHLIMQIGIIAVGRVCVPLGWLAIVVSQRYAHAFTHLKFHLHAMHFDILLYRSCI